MMEGNTRGRIAGRNRERMTTSGHLYLSEGEIVKRLQTLLRDHAEASKDGAARESSTREVRNLAAELAERIYREPEKWGVAAVPLDYRADAAADTLMQLLERVPTMGNPRNIAEWYAEAVEARFKELWSTAEREAKARETEDEKERRSAESLEGAEGAPSVFEENAELWQRFEADFPRDAFALRLRYQMNRDIDQMAVMLDAPSPRAILLRLNRARERFTMYCEQAGLSQKETAGILAHFVEEQAS